MWFGTVLLTKKTMPPTHVVKSFIKTRQQAMHGHEHYQVFYKRVHLLMAILNKKGLRFPVLSLSFMIGLVVYPNPCIIGLNNWSSPITLNLVTFLDLYI